VRQVPALEHDARQDGGGLSELTDRQRRIYELKEGGMSWRDIARQFGISRETARRHYERAVTKIKKEAA
jgi:RNA polymerase sigma factor (sigma-70 family)